MIHLEIPGIWIEYVWSNSNMNIGFDLQLVDKVVLLKTAAEVVQYSFIVQNSISYLDLQLNKSNEARNFSRISSNDTSNSYSNSFISTQEKCQKIHENRYILYTLNLDLPYNREWNLKGESEPNVRWYDREYPHLAKIIICKENYNENIFNIFNDAYKLAEDKLKLLKWLMKLELFEYLPHSAMGYFVDSLHPGIDDSEFVMECFEKVDFLSDEFFFDLRKVENVLYQMHLMRRKSVNLPWADEFLSSCLFDQNMLYVGDVLNYINAPNFCDSFDETMMKAFSYYIWKVPNLEDTMSRKREFLLLHMLDFYERGSYNFHSASESLRLFWMSLPDAFLSLEEIFQSFPKGNIEDTITDMYAFYAKAVGASSSDLEPRSLQHYCRTKVRWSLWKAKQWIPEGIEKLWLPPKLKCYLNLIN